MVRRLLVGLLTWLVFSCMGLVCWRLVSRCRMLSGLALMRCITLRCRIRKKVWITYWLYRKVRCRLLRMARNRWPWTLYLFAMGIARLAGLLTRYGRLIIWLMSWQLMIRCLMLNGLRFGLRFLIFKVEWMPYCRLRTTVDKLQCWTLCLFVMSISLLVGVLTWLAVLFMTLMLSWRLVMRCRMLNGYVFYISGLLSLILMVALSWKERKLWNRMWIRRLMMVICRLF